MVNFTPSYADYGGLEEYGQLNGHLSIKKRMRLALTPVSLTL